MRWLAGYYVDADEDGYQDLSKLSALESYHFMSLNNVGSNLL
jgi:hypothetical protein